MFKHDEFINKACQNIFGQEVQYIPKNKDKSPFMINGDFHEAYVEVNIKTMEMADISTAKVVIFVRMIEFPVEYREPLQGDYIVLACGKQYQIVDIQPHIPGSRKLILHED